MSELVNQSGARALGDIIAGDKITNVYNTSVISSGIVDKLVTKLQQEIEKDQKIRDTVEALQYFQLRKSVDGIDGLEAKLERAARGDEIPSAIEKKEQFVKLLEKWSLYASAQEIFAVLLAKIDHEFNYCIHPQIDKISPVQINQIVTDRIVEPTISTCGTAVFILNHHVVMGMVYWLAEQCFIRWHK